MKTIKIKSGVYPINHFAYVWNGSSLQTLSVKNNTVLEIVPKKYYLDIMFENHEVVDCGFTETLPQRIDLGKKGSKAILMKKEENENENQI